jgi:uncharacterized protein
MTRSLFLLLALFCFLPSAGLHAAEVIPPVPRQYFNDYAHVVPQSDADELNQQLVQFDRDTSNQIVVAIYLKMQSDSDIADYTFRVKETWHVGQKDKNNGAVLFAFIQDRKLFIQVNYGLEGSLPDARCKQIIDQDIAPRFKLGDYTGGLRAGIGAILAATRNEYKGNGRTTGDAAAGSAHVRTISYFIVAMLVIGFLLLGLALLCINSFGGTFYQRHVRSLTFIENAYLFILRIGFDVLLFGGRSSSGGGSSDDGGGGGFSGGGGTGGGGGAGGSW